METNTNRRHLRFLCRGNCNSVLELGGKFMKSKLKSLQKKLTKLTAEAVIRRDDSTCQWCGKWVEGQGRHISHVIPKSEGKVLRWDMENLCVLCYYCHIQKWHHNPMDAAKWFKSQFPERWKYLQEHRREIVKWKAEDYQRMIKEYL